MKQQDTDMLHTHKEEKTKLIKHAGIISLSTVISRMSGLLRDIVSAQMFGLSRVWDAFVYAFMIPNLLRRLVGEGALSSAFIPVYAQVLHQQGEKAAHKLVNVMFSFLTMVLCIFLFCMHFLIQGLLHYGHFSHKITLTFHLLQILFPYIFFLSLVALFIGVLNCHKRFFIPAITPFVLNATWIVTVIIFCHWYGSTPEEQIRILAWGILTAGALQCLVNVGTLMRLGIRPRFVFEWQHPVLVKIMQLMAPAALGFSITQINIFVDMSLAMFLGDGANSALWYGNRLMQFPLGVFGIAMGTALLPTISHQVAQENMDAFKQTIGFSLRSVFVVVIPASVGLIVLRQPLIHLLFERGAFNALATTRTARTLLCYSLGLFAYSGMKLIVSGFYSLQDAKTPVKIGAICMVINIIANIIFMQFLREAGLALATALSSTVNFLVLLFILRKKVGSFGGTHILATFIRVLCASIAMGVCAIFIYSWFSGMIQDTTAFMLFAAISGTILLSFVMYVVFGYVFHVQEIRNILYKGIPALQRK